MIKNLEIILQLLKIDKLKNNKQFVAFLVCLLIATALWFLNALGKDYSTNILYPVKYMNPPKSQFLANEPPSKLELKVDAHGFTLLRYKLSLSFSPIVLNLNTITQNVESNDGKFYIPSSDLVRRVSSQISNEITVREILPDILIIELDSLKSKSVPVKADIDINFKPQFNLKIPLAFDPGQVKITGPAHIIDTIKFVSTQKLEYNEIDNSFSRNVEILHPEKTNITPAKVLLKVEVEKFTEKEIKIPLQVKNKPKDVKIKLFPSEIRVSCMVGLSKFDDITSDDFSAFVNYNDIEENTKNLKVTVKQKTSLAQSTRHTPEAVEFLIETN